MMTMQKGTEMGTDGSQPTIALAYFVGYRDGENFVAAYGCIASLSVVVESFAAAVRARQVARTEFKAYAQGWAVAEAMS